MKRLLLLRQRLQQDPAPCAGTLLWAICISLFVVAFCAGSPLGIGQGLWQIVTHRAGLIADNFAVASVSATFFNAGCVMAVALLLFRCCKVIITGPGVACILLCAGFAMFGKDPLNIWPIIGGVYLYAKRQKDHFGKYLYSALYGTALAPLVTEIALIRGDWLSLLAAIAAGLLMGFMIPPLSTYCLRIHQGYSLYNVGFSAGLVGTLLVALLRSFGYSPQSQSLWSDEPQPLLLCYLLGLFVLLFVLGFWASGWKLEPLKALGQHSGRLMSDFILMDGLPAVLMNMGILGLGCLLFLALSGGHLNGATIGGIFTVVGFGALGKHWKNVTPVVLGVVLGSLLKVWNLNDPAVQLAALFGTCLAPISGQYGWKYGLAAGFLHSSLVLSIGVFHGGLNLYNNGFSAGLVALILVPLIESIEGEKLNASR